MAQFTGVRILKTYDVSCQPVEGMSANTRARILADRRGLHARFCMEDSASRWTTLLEGDKVCAPGTTTPFFEVGPHREAIGRMKFAFDSLAFG